MGNVNEWLKFAEAKLAALVAANGAAVFGALQILTNSEKFNSVARLYLQSFLCCSSIAIVVGIVAILPKTSLPWVRSTKPIQSTDNLLFFGHIAKYNPEEYLDSLYAATGDSERQEWSRTARNYAQQIIINSHIASTKYALFRWSAWFTLAAVLTPIIALPLLIWLVDRSD
ncbi:MAG: Pycsar system effector family protein [Gemmatimonadota bacterium]